MIHRTDHPYRQQGQALLVPGSRLPAGGLLLPAASADRNLRLQPPGGSVHAGVLATWQPDRLLPSALPSLHTQHQFPRDWGDAALQPGGAGAKLRSVVGAASFFPTAGRAAAAGASVFHHRPVPAGRLHRHVRWRGRAVRHPGHAGHVWPHVLQAGAWRLFE